MTERWYYYRNPEYALSHIQSYGDESHQGIGCEVCSKNKFSKKLNSWYCLIGVPDYPNLDATLCKDWRHRHKSLWDKKSNS